MKTTGAAGAVELFVIRHARAGSPGDRWPNDDDRPITDDGRARFLEVVQGLARLDVSFDRVVSSPLVRARDTALLLAPLTRNPEIALLDALGPGGRPAAVLRGLAALKGSRRLAVVGHEPGLGALVAYLLGASRPIGFKKGGVACLELARVSPATTATLRWFAPPSLLRRLAH
jgi:phosphohistidine phosphatase